MWFRFLIWKQLVCFLILFKNRVDHICGNLFHLSWVIPTQNQICGNHFHLSWVIPTQNHRSLLINIYKKKKKTVPSSPILRLRIHNLLGCPYPNHLRFTFMHSTMLIGLIARGSENWLEVMQVRNLVSQSYKKKQNVARSSTRSSYRAIAKAIVELVWLNLFKTS